MWQNCSNFKKNFKAKILSMLRNVYFCILLHNVVERSALRLYKKSIILGGTKYSRMDQVKFVEDGLQKNWSNIVCYVKFFKGWLPQNSLGPFLNTLSQVSFSLTFDDALQF